MSKKLLSTLFLITVLTFYGFGQEMSFEAKAPETVSVGQQFRLSFTLNAEGKDFKFPQSIDGFEIIYGPSTSSSYSSSIVDGKRVTASSVSYNYVLKATRNGTFTIPAATIEVNGNKTSSNVLKIQVSGKSKNQDREESDKDSKSEQNTTKSSTKEIKASDAFIQTSVSRKQVYEQESFAVTYKLYTKLDVQSVRDVDFPDFEGFKVDELDVSNNRLQQETYKGEKYYTVVVRQLLLTPQQKGTLKIPEGKIGLVFQTPTGVQSIFGEQMSLTTKYISTESAKIDVESLPAPKPADFSNVAGSYSISSSISTNQAKVNDLIRIRIVISGNGNTNRIATPEIKLPENFDSDRPKVSQSIDVSESGLVATKTIEYLFVPRESGEFTIPSTTISYFDTETKTYKTLTTPEYNLKVGKNITRNSKEIFVQIDSPKSGEMIL